ncbi:RidA family protein [Barrientosiimonas marina]|uniref:RidA family protein n=1 Tax=Lentibacillus kimchii TaxID=1542911 RepID=A0ABW2UZE7_9BACI
MRQAIQTDKAPASIGPYSQAVKVNGVVYISGQIGLNPETGALAEGIENQTHQVMHNLQAILTEADAFFSQVVKFTIYLASMDHFATVNDIYGSYLTEPYPARAAFEVSQLPKGALIEIEAIVYTNA